MDKYIIVIIIIFAILILYKTNSSIFAKDEISLESFETIQNNDQFINTSDIKKPENTYHNNKCAGGKQYWKLTNANTIYNQQQTEKQCKEDCNNRDCDAYLFNPERQNCKLYKFSPNTVATYQCGKGFAGDIYDISDGIISADGSEYGEIKKNNNNFVRQLPEQKCEEYNLKNNNLDKFYSLNMEDDKLEIKDNNIKNTACKVFEEEKQYVENEKRLKAEDKKIELLKAEVESKNRGYGHEAQVKMFVPQNATGVCSPTNPCPGQGGDGQPILHWVAECGQCNINWCDSNKWLLNIPNLLGTNMYRKGSDLSSWGCDKVNNNTQVVRDTSGAIYAIEHTKNKCEGLSQRPGDGGCNHYCSAAGKGKYYRSDLGGCTDGGCVPTNEACRDSWLRTRVCNGKCAYEVAGIGGGPWGGLSWIS